ncbi:unnamed protein product [Peronospora belbahrii]|uniref:Uncharacterized protein n=1 Tax=Peronospora belbahrii TaxID=622444 RepID=A0AAU9KWY1_9STRA|nr:unnamed protein product [Peronospora belbahrii]
MKFTPGLVFAALAVTAAYADTPNTYLRKDDDDLKIDLNELFGDTKNIGKNGKINILDLIGSSLDTEWQKKYLKPQQADSTLAKGDGAYKSVQSKDDLDSEDEGTVLAKSVRGVSKPNIPANPTGDGGDTMTSLGESTSNYDVDSPVNDGAAHKSVKFDDDGMIASGKITVMAELSKQMNEYLDAQEACEAIQSQPVDLGIDNEKFVHPSTGEDPLGKCAKFYSLISKPIDVEKYKYGVEDSLVESGNAYNDASSDDDDEDEETPKVDGKYPLSKDDGIIKDDSDNDDDEETPKVDGDPANKGVPTVHDNEDDADDFYSSKNPKESKKKNASAPSVGHLFVDYGDGVIGDEEDTLVVKDSKGKTLMMENDPTQNDHLQT